MAYIRFDCTKCGQRLKAPPTLAGERAKCTKCGTRVFIPGEWRGSRTVRFEPADRGSKYCRDCGQGIFENAEICPHCGCRQMPTHGNREPKNRFVAAMLAFFLGGVGFHKFYLNHPMAGVMYLIGFVLCASTLILMWIPPLCALVECIILLAMSDERFHDTYG